MVFQAIINCETEEEKKAVEDFAQNARMIKAKSEIKTEEVKEQHHHKYSGKHK